MSVLVSTDNGFVISHETYICETYRNVEKLNSVYKFGYLPTMFKINTAFKKDLEAQKAAETKCEEDYKRSRTRKRACDASNAIAQRVQVQAKCLLLAAQKKGLFLRIVTTNDVNDNNSEARSVSDNFYKSAARFELPTAFSGANATPKARVETVGDQQFLFPKDSHFFCHDVLQMHEKLPNLGTFDLIIIDPPWWNKYIRRKRLHDEADGYKMLSCDDLARIPVVQLLRRGALVAVWCTNSESHLSDLKHILMPSWGTKHVASWCWLKVTTSGEPVCPYSKPPGKQPYEQLLFGVEMNVSMVNRSWPCPADEQLLISVPSAVHSHKPPLLDVMKHFLPPEPRCLEIFARSLLPGCTSWGLEVLKLQHTSLFTSEQTDFTFSSEPSADQTKVNTSCKLSKSQSPKTSLDVLK